MEPLIRLPKTARVYQDRYTPSLVIENHKKQGGQGFMEWLAEMFITGRWPEILPQLIQQGFKFDGVIEECLADMEDPTKFRWILSWFTKMMNKTNVFMEPISKNKIGMEIKNDTVKKLGDCRNWDDLYILMEPGSDFMTGNDKKIRAEMVRMRKENNE